MTWNSHLIVSVLWTYAVAESCFEEFGVCFWLTRSIHTLKEDSWCQHVQNRAPPCSFGCCTHTHTTIHPLSKTSVLWNSGQVAPWKCFTGEIKSLNAEVFGAPLLPKEESNTRHNEALLAISPSKRKGGLWTQMFLLAILWLRLRGRGLRIPAFEGQKDLPLQ